MTRWENYLLSAEKIIAAYDGALPLHHFLKAFFRQHPHMGSRDRRRVSQLVYGFYRLGHLWKQTLPVRERILSGVFLCETQPDELLAFFRPEWNEQVQQPLPAKLLLASPTGEAPVPEDIFPFSDELSGGLPHEAFAYSFFIQPRLFIRVRHRQQKPVTAALQEAGVAFEQLEDEVISLPNGTRIEDIIPAKEAYEIQDASSVQTGRLFRPRPQEHWWDCCAASGGKSILLRDLEPTVQLLVSDIRPSILQNLEQRFHAAGLRQYESRVMDLTQPVNGTRSFDGILLDAPCSGSGTWGRTPENLYFFDQQRIRQFQELQKRIAGNVVPLLKPGGALIYITCSVFRKENEEVVQYLCESAGLQRQEGGLLPGYTLGADTMFAVRLLKP
jgi:16S rRNA (cytosine967-C5)-methyltransferase